MPAFSQEQKSKLIDELTEEQINARNIAIRNAFFNNGFRIALLLLSISVAITSAYLTVYKKDPPGNLAVLNLCLSSLATIFSGFAFTQYKFGHREAIWHKIADSYTGLITELQFTDPEPGEFLRKLQKIREAGNDTPIDTKFDL